MAQEPTSPFSTFVITLATSALLYLGEIPDPEGKQKVVNLQMAKETIDILNMLHEKTRGNLTREEQETLDRFLYDLRVKFVARAKDQKK